MNYTKLVAALKRQGLTDGRSYELAHWCCNTPSGTPYPEPTTSAAFRGTYVEEEHPRDERGRWTFKDGSGSSSGGGSESPAKRKAREELNGDITAAIAECYSNDLEKYEKAKTPEEREHYREKLNEEIRLLLEYGEDYEWEDSDFADVARETKKRLAEEKRKREEQKKKKPAPGTKIERKDGRLAYRKETREEQVDRLLKEREEAEHFAQRYANNEELRKRYERAVREYDRQLDELGVE